MPAFFLHYLLLSDSRCSHHSSGHAVLGAVGKQDVGAAGGAESDFRDIFRGESGVEQLAAVGFGQVEEDLLGQFTVAGGARSQEEQRIFFVDLVRLFGDAEETASITELRFESSANLGPDLIATSANAGTDDGFQVAGTAAEVSPHLSDALFDNSLDRSAPSGMEDANGLAFCVHNNDGKAIGGQDGQQDSRGSGYKAIAGQRLFRSSCNVVDEVGMNLTQGGQRPGSGLVFDSLFSAGFCGNGRGKGLAVALDGGARVVGGETQIQATAAVGFGDAADSGAESMDQPGYLR